MCIRWFRSFQRGSAILCSLLVAKVESYQSWKYEKILSRTLSIGYFVLRIQSQGKKKNSNYHSVSFNSLFVSALFCKSMKTLFKTISNFPKDWSRKGAISHTKLPRKNCCYQDRLLLRGNSRLLFS